MLAKTNLNNKKIKDVIEGFESHKNNIYY